MADHCKKARLGAVRSLRLVACMAESVLGLDAIRDVAADALDLRTGFATDGNLSPGDPAHKTAAGDLLIINASAVGLNGEGATFKDGQLFGGPDQRVARSACERAESVIRIGNAARAVAAHDEVALSLQQTACALFGLAQLPKPVR